MAVNFEEEIWKVDNQIQNVQRWYRTKITELRMCRKSLMKSKDLVQKVTKKSWTENKETMSEKGVSDSKETAAECKAEASI